METYIILLINSIITILVGGWLFRYFDLIFNTQADLIDKILKILPEIVNPPENPMMDTSEEE